jgi:hypothetical protein
MSEVTEVKKTKKLAKEIEGSVVKISVEGGVPMEFDFAALPKDIRVKFGPFGLGHKLGDAAAGKSGAEAEESINKVWEGLMSGDWTTRAPAAPKLTKKAIAENLGNLDEASQAAAKELLAKLGIAI